MIPLAPTLKKADQNGIPIVRLHYKIQAGKSSL